MDKKKEMNVELKNKHYKIKNGNIPINAIHELIDKSIDGGDINKIKEALTDIYIFTGELGHGNVFIHKPKSSLTESSCIEYINNNGMSDYYNALVGHITYSLLNQDKESIHTLEHHFVHIHSIWFHRGLKDSSDQQTGEMLLVLLSDAIGMLRGFYNMERSPIVVACADEEKNKCPIYSCFNRSTLQFINPINGEMMKFCKDCHEKIMSFSKNSRMVGELLSKSNGEMVVIDTWKEFKDRLMPEFLQMMIDCLQLTGDECCVCGEKAIATGYSFRPYCAECMGFPRNVLTVALKDGGKK